MEEEIFEKLENVCRTCMAVGNESLQSIYDTIEGFRDQETYIFELINNTIHQLPKIGRSDELPKFICRNCVVKLSTCYEFQQCCISTDIHLRKLIATNTVDCYSENAPTTLDPLQDDNQSFDFPIVELIKQEELENSLEICNEMVNDEGIDRDTTPEISQSETLNSEEVTPKYENSTKRKKIGLCVTCQSCEKQFSNAKYLRRHTKRMHNNELLQESSNCQTNNEAESESKKDSVFKCDECGSEFGKKVYLRKHKYRHKRPGGMRISKKCDSCDMVFHTVQSLKTHRFTAHPDLLTESNKLNLKKPYVCEFCNKGFQQSCTLKDHKRIHTKEAPYLCSDCGKAFKSNSNLRQHLLRHSGEKRYECPDCPKKFPCLSDLCSHKQVHKQLRPHVCDICGAAFAKYYQLKKHNMYHSGEKPHQCDYCEMRFVCADHMRRHMRTHTGEKPYKCKYCTRTFTQSNDMIKHLRSHLGVNVYQCELCPLAFRLAAELRQHFAFHKNDDEETRDRNKRELMEAQEKLRKKLELDNLISPGENNQ